MKVVINACYGGFSLSKAAVLRGREIANDPMWGGFTLPGETYADGGVNTTRLGSIFDSYYPDVPRSDLVLVGVVEDLGDAANGACAKLQIVDIPAGTLFRIDEYDGREHVETRDSVDWKVAT